jgi:hypothetical protein
MRTGLMLGWGLERWIFTLMRKKKGGVGGS